MESSDPAGPPVRRDGAVDGDDPAAQADRHLAELMEQAEMPGDRALREPTLVFPAEQPELAPAPRRARDSDQREVIELARAALAATDRLAEVVEVMGAQADAAAGDVALLTRAISQALEATNQRLADLEQLLLAEDAPDAAPAVQAVTRLRLRVRGPTGGHSSVADPGSPPEG